MKRTRRRRRARLAAVTLAVALPTAGAEMALRAVEPTSRVLPTREALIGCWDPVLGWTNCRNLTCRVRELSPVPPHDPVLDYTVTLNALGVRSRREYGARAPGVKRVAVLGDSFTFGVGVEDGETFCARLEGPRREVLNFGVAGYGVGQMHLRLVNEALPLRPDLVLIAIIEADLARAVRAWADNGYPMPRARLDGDRLMIGTAPLPPPLPPGSELPRPGLLVLERARSAAARAAASTAGRPREAASPAWRLGSAFLRSSADACRRAEVPFGLVLLTSDRGGRSPLHDLLLTLGSEFPVIDLGPAVRAVADGGGAPFLPLDGHPSAAGHAAMAAALERELVARGLLPAHP